ncbi:hypothetical protein HQ585_14245 [candidate division KSB1 bacterium]|nr:hypothetical protein [candidate division KSB1 bacterium]
MVLQRETELKIWGWASANEQVTLTFLDGTYQAVKGDEGRWEVKLPPMKAGGPHTINILAKITSL